MSQPQPARRTEPSRRLTDRLAPAPYVPAAHTDIRHLFERVRQERRASPPVKEPS